MIEDSEIYVLYLTRNATIIDLIMREDTECRNKLTELSSDNLGKSHDEMRKLTFDPATSGIAGSGGFNMLPRTVNVLEFEKDPLAKEVYFTIQAKINLEGQRKL